MRLGNLFRRPRAALAAGVVPALVLALACLSGAAGRAATAAGSFRLPAIRHVWVIELENEGYPQSFGKPAADPYLARTLPGEGALLRNYFAIGHASADNYIAQVSGQAPDVATQLDCPVWLPFAGHVVISPYHQLLGAGCVFPASVPTLGNQLSAAGLSWKAYLEDMGNDPARDRTVNTAQGPACGHPATWGIDHTRNAERGDQYAVRHEGFMFFKAVTGNQAFCDAHLLSFRPLLSGLSAAGTTPAFSWITPNMCDDGHDAPCATGARGGLAQADAFLRAWVPRITASPAYRDGGLIMITFDEGSTKAACCGESSGLSSSHPNTPFPGGLGGAGGGDVGMVLLSPFIRPGTVSTADYNHYSMLRTIEDIFGLSHLGDAAMAAVRPFGADVFTAP
ncbi:MAG: hypothetical protein JOY82_09300 [Streptosporangiaceae bacterium]|nr:hypothetical protein [Streptosporangiaceae bacterium]MBV9854708.1 hypothetical protein [Streptosporangiaceae bacterium]